MAGCASMLLSTLKSAGVNSPLRSISWYVFNEFVNFVSTKNESLVGVMANFLRERLCSDPTRKKLSNHGRFDMRGKCRWISKIYSQPVFQICGRLLRHFPPTPLITTPLINLDHRVNAALLIRIFVFEPSVAKLPVSHNDRCPIPTP